MVITSDCLGLLDSKGLSKMPSAKLVSTMKDSDFEGTEEVFTDRWEFVKKKNI